MGKWGDYWSQPVHRYHIDPAFELQRGHGLDAEGRAQHLQPGVCEQGRAQHLHHGSCGSTRAWQHDGVPEGVRAQQWQHGELGDRGQAGAVPSGAGRHQDLPELQSCLILGNWLEVIAPIRKDVSPQAHRWWILVENEAKQYYEKWRDAAPMARLYIKPACKVVEDDPSLQRTEQSGIALLIKAPEHIKETMVSERMMTSTGIIFTLMKHFQPGGASERTALLKTLTSPAFGKSIKEATSSLRTWRRVYVRTGEIGATLPDPTVLLKALGTPVTLQCRALVNACKQRWIHSCWLLRPTLQAMHLAQDRRQQ